MKYRVLYDSVQRDIYIIEAESPGEAVKKVEADLLLEPDDYEEIEIAPYAVEVEPDEIIDLEDGSPVSRYDVTKEDHV